jgi:drug/metabolite transporter (DMT)-like permease
MLVYGFVIVVLGQLFWLKGLRGSTITSVSLASSFTPMVGVLAAYLVLGEAPNLAQYIGSSFILVGIILGQVGIRWQNWGKSNLFKAKSPQIAQDLGSGVGFKGM